jgi:hypothetical protein
MKTNPLPALLLVAVVGCVRYPTNPGYINVTPRPERGVDLALYAGGGAEIWSDGFSTGGGAGGLNVEPWLTDKMTLPITAVGGGSDDTGGAATRLGLRYRPTSWVSIGGGVGGGVYVVHESDPLGNHHEGALHLDIELGVGGMWRFFGFSVGVRPTFEVTYGFFLLSSEFVIALYPMEMFAITVHVYGGPWVVLDPDDRDVGGWIAGGLGFVVHIPSRKSQNGNHLQ